MKNNTNTTNNNTDDLNNIDELGALKNNPNSKQDITQLQKFITMFKKQNNS